MTACPRIRQPLTLSNVSVDAALYSCVNHLSLLSCAGGCDERTRPTDVKTCEDPPCNTVSFSYCQDTNSCRCQNGYRPLYDNGGQLVECQFIVMVFNRSRGTDADNAALYIPSELRPQLWWLYTL